MKKLKKLRCLALTLVLPLISVAGCRGQNEIFSSSTGFPSSQSQATAISTFPVPSGSTQTSGATESANAMGSTHTQAADSSEGTMLSTTSTTTTKPVSGTTAAQQKLEVSLAQWHPGIPGYDAAYQISVKYGGLYVNADDIQISCETSGVRIQDGSVIVPESVRNKEMPVKVVARYKPTGQTASLNIPVKKWNMTFSDEFNGTDLDMSKWSLEESCYENDIAATVRENHRVKDGHLDLFGEKRTVTMYGMTKEYVTAACTTKGSFKQRYGCFLASMKVPRQGGLNAAFWLIPGGSYGKNYGSFLKEDTNFGLAEIDIIEISNNWDDHYYITEHFYDYTKNYEHMQRSFYVDVEGDTVNEWHTYGCVWEKDALYYYCDGRLVGVRNDLAEASAGGVKGREMYILFSLGMGEPEGGWLGGWTFDEADFPATMSVDWVRAYK